MYLSLKLEARKQDLGSDMETMTRTITPIKDFILLELPIDEEARIITLDKGNVKQIDVTSLVVLKVGKDCKFVKEGDKVVTDINAIAPVKVDGKQYFITKEFNVGCIIR